ncbi:MAG: hypothetical protein WC967_01000 [Balneolaceae bacterium]
MFGQQVVDGSLVLSPVKIDSVYQVGEWLIPESISLTSNAGIISVTSWQYQAKGGTLHLKENGSFDFSQVDTLYISYKTLPYAIRRSFSENDIPQYDSTRFTLNQDSLANAILLNQSTNTFSDSDLRQSGSLSRGIVVGTNQDFTLESGLNFELAGRLTKDLTIEAALTDRNIPIQPDGTTQNLREFDRVFIQLQSPTTKLQMGDVDVQFEQSAFAKLNRRLQGAAGYNSSKAGVYAGAVSVVRGTYKSMKFDGNDGVQGPYRLKGDENEQFVIILAGTERVYINGQQVQRGEENEYVIDYGLGEVHFTNNLLIKDETRIVIEYEYISQNFNRTLVAAEGADTFFDGKLSFGATVIRQADGNDLLSQQTLTEDDIEILKSVGDNLDNAIVSGAEFYDETDKVYNVRYAKRDTTVNGQTQSIYINAPGAGDAIYRVRFSNVGQGIGSYKRVGSSVNGLIYEWVGAGNGDYEPFRKLPAPQKQQMAAFSSSYKIAENATLFGEWAVSEFDKNRFSSLDNEDNVDMAYQGGIKVEGAQTEIGKLNASISRRFSGDKFKYFERTQDVEFDRKWNITDLSESQEAVNEAALGLSFSESTNIGAEYGFVDRQGFKSQRQASHLKIGEEEKVHLNYAQDWVTSKDNNFGQDGNWFRQNMTLNKVFKLTNYSLTPYVYAAQEKKVEKNQITDSLSSQAFSFYDVGPGLAFSTNQLHLDYSVGYRQQNGVLSNSLRKESDAITQKIIVDYAPSSYLNTRNQIQLRSKTVDDSFQNVGDNLNKKSLLIRSNTSYSTIADNWNGELLYEVNTKRQALYQETYIEVGPELGQFVWEDLNEDGVQQIDEFFPELSPNEGTYLRQLLPSDELFPVIDLNFRLRNEIHPFEYLEGEDGMGFFLRQLKVKSRIAIRENSTTDHLSDVYLLNVSTFRNDSTTIQGRLAWEKELDILPEYNRTNLTLRYNQLRSLNRRSSEILTLYNDALAIDGSIKITDTIETTLLLTKSTNTSESSSLNSRSYNIEAYSIEPGFNATINRSWRTGVNISYSNKTDKAPIVPVNAKTFKIRNVNRLFLFRKIQANTSLELRNVRINGVSSSYGLFEITDGTGKGTSVLWSAGGSYRMGDLIRLNFTYDGRAMKERPTIHTFKIVVNAIF